jgi:hypothetical protein
MFGARKRKQQKQSFEHASSTTCNLYAIYVSTILLGWLVLPAVKTEVIPEDSADLGSWLGNVYKIRTIN